MSGYTPGPRRPAPPNYIKTLYDRHGDPWFRLSYSEWGPTPPVSSSPGYAVKWTSDALRALSPFTTRPTRSTQ